MVALGGWRFVMSEVPLWDEPETGSFRPHSPLLALARKKKHAFLGITTMMTTVIPPQEVLVERSGGHM